MVKLSNYLISCNSFAILNLFSRLYKLAQKKKRKIARNSELFASIFRNSVWYFSHFHQEIQTFFLTTSDLSFLINILVNILKLRDKVRIAVYILIVFLPQKCKPKKATNVNSELWLSFSRSGHLATLTFSVILTLHLNIFH